MPTQIVSAGNTAFITQNVTDTDDQVLSGGTLQINPGGTGSSTTVSGGGLERIGLPNSDAVAVDTTVLASGTEVILGGLSVSAVISGGAQFVYGGSAIGAVVISGTQFVEVASSINAGALHGSATGTVLSGGEQVVAGTAMDTVLSLGAIQDVESRGVASGTTVEGGFAEVFGLTVSSTYQAGTMDFVYSGGMADESMLNGGSEYVESGGTAVGTVIAAGGAQVVYGRTQFTSVTGGIQYVEAGAIVGLTEIEAAQILFGSASSSTVFSGGGEYIYSGGVASGTTISFGGAEFVEAGGTASRSTLGAAVQMVYGLAVSTVLDNGGAEYVESGGTAVGTMARITTYEYVAAGATVSGATIVGGTVELAAGAEVGAAPILFVNRAGGILQLDDSQHFSGTVAGFAKPAHLDLADIAFTSTTSADFVEADDGTSGTLTVTNGLATARMTLLGQHAAGEFLATANIYGGTTVLDLSPTAALATIVAGHG